MNFYSNIQYQLFYQKCVEHYKTTSNKWHNKNVLPIKNKILLKICLYLDLYSKLKNTTNNNCNLTNLALWNEDCFVFDFPFLFLCVRKCTHTHSTCALR